jgi:predicted ATPase
MIRSFRLQNFKCFKDERFEFRPLSLIVGANGAGKSSLLQALLIAHQASSTPAPYVRLNGPLGLDLGSATDVLCQSSDGSPNIHFEATDEGGVTLEWKLEARAEELVLHINEQPEGRLNVAYLNAERIGPRETLNADSVPSDAMSVGCRGEFTAQVLVAHERTRVPEALRHPRTTENLIQLGKQLELWMGDIAPGIEIRATKLSDTSISALRLKHHGVGTDWLRPPNIGFGISYALPIIVAGLLARPGSIFLVENPEAHLHPGGQSRMGRFLATLAAAGIQVLVETHSDHVLNGVLLATVDAHPIRHDQVIIQYFHGDAKAERRALAIDVNTKGGLSTWPKGFFDQSERDMAAILEARRRG